MKRVVFTLVFGVAMMSQADSRREEPPAVHAVAVEMLKQSLTMKPEAPVGIFIESDQPEVGRALASQLATELANQKLAPVVIDAATAADAERSARNHGIRSLIRVTAAVSDSKISARGDAISTWVNFWSGATPTRSGNSAVISISIAADEQAFTLAGMPVTPVEVAPTTVDLKMTPAAKFQGLPAAIAIGDLDGDSHPEIAVLGGDDLYVFSSEGKPLAHVGLSTAMSKTPTREPWGVISIQGNRAIVWSARREKPEAFSFNSGTIRSRGVVDQFTLDDMALTLKPGITRISSQLTWAGKSVKAPDDFQTIQTRKTLTLVHYGNASASIGRGTFPTTRFAGIGSAITLFDTNGDDTVEVFTSSPKSTGTQDDLRVYSLSNIEGLQSRNGATAELTAAWQLSVPHGRALLAAAADLDGKPGDEIALVTVTPEGSELLILRSVTK